MQQTMTINIDPHDFGITDLALPLGFAPGDIRHLASTVPTLVDIVKAQIVIERRVIFDVVSSPISTVIIYVTQEAIKAP
ncbi:hypothetical protein MRX96_049330 [Rhipicephalus microplus]